MQFPAFTHGPFLGLHRQVLRLGKQWSESFKKSGRFPAPALQEVEPGSTVYTFEVTDLDRTPPRWRLYFVERLATAVREAAEWDDPGAIRSAFERHVQAFPWGALSTALNHGYPNSIDRVSERITSLLSFWEVLDRLRYVDRGPVRVVHLAEVVSGNFRGLIDMWCDQQTGNVRSDLANAVVAMKRASRSEVSARLVRALAAVARSDRRTRDWPTLVNPESIAKKIGTIEAEILLDLETGYEPYLLRQLFILEPAATRGS